MHIAHGWLACIIRPPPTFSRGPGSHLWFTHGSRHEFRLPYYCKCDIKMISCSYRLPGVQLEALKQTQVFSHLDFWFSQIHYLVTFITLVWRELHLLLFMLMNSWLNDTTHSHPLHSVNHSIWDQWCGMEAVNMRPSNSYTGKNWHVWLPEK